MADNVSIDPGTATPIATDDVGGVQFQKIKLNLGGDGVDGSTWDGKVAVTAGTIGAFTADIPGGTIDTISALPDLPGGTVDLITSVTTVGTVTGAGTVASVGQIHNAGTIAALPDLPGGTVDSVTEVANLAKGTVTRVEGGSIVVTAGTVVTTMGDLSGGTIDLLTAGTISPTQKIMVSGTATMADHLPVPSTDCLNYRNVSFQLIGDTWTGTVVFEASNDNSNFQPVIAQNIDSKSGNGYTSTATSTGDIYNLSVPFRYFRARVSDYTAGTMIGVATFSASNLSSNNINVGANVQSGTITEVTNGSIVVTAGTVTTTMGDLSGGTVDLITDIANLSKGTITRLEGGTVGLVSTLSNLSNGTVRVTAGTVGGAAATAVALSGNPVPIAGVDAGGTVYGLLTDTAGVLQVNGTVTTGGAGTQDVRLIDGTVTNVGTVANIGVIHNAGTIAALPNTPGGTLGLVTTVTNLSNGTIQNSGTVTGVGVVSNLTSGSVRMTVGTLTVMPNIPGGTIGVVSALTSGTLQDVITVGNITNGTIRVTAGTVRQDGRPSRNMLTYGTQLVGTAAAYATLVAAAGSGTSIWVQDVSVTTNNGGVVCMVGFGTALQGTSVLVRGVYGTNVTPGIEKPYRHAVNAGMTNTDLVAYIGAAGTIDVTVSYFVSAA